MNGGDTSSTSGSCQPMPVWKIEEVVVPACSRRSAGKWGKELVKSWEWLPSGSREVGAGRGCWVSHGPCPVRCSFPCTCKLDKIQNANFGRAWHFFWVTGIPWVTGSGEALKQSY